MTDMLKASHDSIRYAHEGKSKIQGIIILYYT